MEFNILAKSGRVAQLKLKIGKWRFVLCYKLSLSVYEHNPLGMENLYDDMANRRFIKC
jgi:hypothetical protein